MKKPTLSRISIFVLVLSTLCFVQAKDSFAKPPRPRQNHVPGPSFRHSPPRPYYHRNLPWGCISLRVADMLYYYLEGTYYRETPSGYVVVAAPRGALITTLPQRNKVIVYDNTDYYYYNSTYYVKQPTGYTVVTPPPSVVSSNAPAVEAPEKTIVVTVPNPNGSYIPVTLQKYSDGYVGPNGEFYPDYPTIDQLKAMYAKSSAIAERPEPAELTLDIPNKNGSITKVKVTRTKDGYVGPEGEYYTQKPTIEQLKIMYAKN
ncbi:MAG: hypothetical protein A2351_02100 [Omnitrophica bacterium RIFOXYB12_FULL_50_7]|nr:MAG: hypothetical protein A2351_02100 [Omnitrophica bacterium RIFOXYB12_FULL_50_7]